MVPVAAAAAVVSVALVGLGAPACRGPNRSHVTSRRGAARFDAAAARERLVARFEAGRRATWLVQFDFVRTLKNGQGLRGDITEANRPPDHLTSGIGGASGTRAGRQITCTEVRGATTCAASGTPAPPFEQTLAEQVANLRDVLVVPHHWYDVTRITRLTIAGERGDCFLMTRITVVPSPPYGERTEMCFAADGVPLRTRIERSEGTDERTATRVQRTVTDADLNALETG